MKMPLTRQGALLPMLSVLVFLRYTSGRIRSGINAADAVFLASRTQESSEIQTLELKVAEAYDAALATLRLKTASGVLLEAVIYR